MVHKSSLRLLRNSGAPSALKQIVHKSSSLYSLFNFVIYNSVGCAFFTKIRILEYEHTVIKAFADLVIFRAIAGNITSYCWEIFAHLKGSIPCHSRDFFQLQLGIGPALFSLQLLVYSISQV